MPMTYEMEKIRDYDSIYGRYPSIAEIQAQLLELNPGKKPEEVIGELWGVSLEVLADLRKAHGEQWWDHYQKMHFTNSKPGVGALEQQLPVWVLNAGIKIDNGCLKSAVVEVVSLNCSPSLLLAEHQIAQHKQSVSVGMEAVDALTGLGLSVTTCALVDDYFHYWSSEDREQLLAGGFFGLMSPPEQVFWEKDLASAAGDLVLQLGISRKVSGKPFKWWALNGEPVMLVDGYQYSCSLLDAALYIMKHEQSGGVCVTVLPAAYSHQQKEVQAILKAAGHQIPIVNVFYTPRGEISMDFSY